MTQPPIEQARTKLQEYETAIHMFELFAGLVASLGKVQELVSLTAAWNQNHTNTSPK